MLNIRFYYFNLSDHRKDLCIFGVKFRNCIKWTSNFIWIVPLKRSLNCCPWLIPRQNPPCHRWLLMNFFTAQVGVDSKTITNWLLYRWFRKYRRWCQTHQLQAPFVMSGTNFHCGEKPNEKSPHRSVQQNRCGDFPSYFLHLTSTHTDSSSYTVPS